jgi:hypothetical protein
MTSTTAVMSATENPADDEQKTETVSSLSSSSPSNNNAIICSTCKTPQTKTVVLKKCSCHAAQYCNKKCQKEHRKEHAKECRRLTAKRKLEKRPKEKTKAREKEEGERKANNDDNNVKTAPKMNKKEEEGDECPICLEILPKNGSKFTRFTCCGNGIHIHCFKDMQSMNMDGSCPFCRAKTPSSDEESVNYLRPWVKKKKAWAQNMMGEMYRDGEGVKRSCEMAVRLFEQAAHLGHADAQVNLGCLYANGLGERYDNIKRMVGESSSTRTRDCNQVS